MKKTITLLILLYSYISFSQEVTVKGFVFDEYKKPIPNILVVVFSTKKTTIAYQYTNNQGEFNLLVKKENTPIFIKTSSLFYEEQKKELDFTKKKEITFSLLPKIETLNEVVITTVKINRDTVNLGIQKYNIKKTESIENTLKKIPGISIDKNGRIKYWNKEIEKILIDGDDLANKQYTFISQNLRSEVLEDIQILKNFEENTVFKKSRKSDKIALNLKIKQKFKNIWFGNASLGYGADIKNKKKLKNNFNLGLLKKNVKFLNFAKHSSLGEKSTPFFLEGTDNEQENNFTYKIRNEKISLPETVTNLNNYFSNTFLVNKKFNNLTFRSTNFAGIDRQKQESYRTTTYFLQPISFTENTNYDDKRIAFFGDGVLEPKGQRNSYFSNKFNYKIISTTTSSLINYNNENISDFSKNRKYSFYNNSQYTHRFINSLILNSHLYFGWSKLRERTTVNSPFLKNFLKNNIDTKQYIDKNIRFFKLETEANYLLSKGLKTNLLFSYNKKKEKFKQFLIPNDNLYENDAYFNRGEFIVRPSFIYKMSKKVKLKGNLSLNFLKLNKTTNTLLNYSLIANIKFLGNLELSYAKKEKFPNNNVFLENYYLINNTTFKKGNNVLTPLKYDLFKFKLNSYTKNRAFNNEVLFTYKKTSSLLLNTYTFSDNINFNQEIFNDKKGEDFLFRNQLIFLANKLGFKIETSQIYSLLPLDGNNNAINKLYNGQYKLELTSYFNSNLNFKFELEYATNTQKYKENISSFESKNLLLDVNWNINKEITLNINSGVYELANRYYKISNVNLNYVPKKSKFSYNFRINNLLNEDEFTFQERNSFFYYKQTIPLIPLYTFASVKYIF